jgi:hypothetical protein
METNTWAIGHSYADDPLLTPALYGPDAAQSNRWSTNGLVPEWIILLRFRFLTASEDRLTGEIFILTLHFVYGFCF